MDGREVGDLKGNGYEVYPYSTIDGHEYRFIPGYEMSTGILPFPEELFPVQLNVPPQVAHRIPDEIRDVRRYIRGIRAISGSGGHNATFRVACCLRDVGLSESEALVEMIAWQEEGHAEPPWTIRELAHKCRDAFRRVTA